MSPSVREPRLAGTPVQGFYRRQAGWYDATRWLFLYGRRRAVKLLGLPRDGAVLEVGCGTGRNFHLLLAGLNPGRGRLVGLDFSEPMLARARRRTIRYGWGNVELLVADATCLALARSFHAVFFAYSLSMIPGWETALERAAAHLRPGGRLVVLDFGALAGWGSVGGLARRWLRFNHVEVGRPYGAALARFLADVCEEQHAGGYYVTIVGTKAAGM